MIALGNIPSSTRKQESPTSRSLYMKLDRLNSCDSYTRETVGSIIAGINAKNSQMLVGNPGLGKSALVGMVAEMLEYKMITIIGSQKEPQDVTGFPRLVEKPLPDGGTVSVTEYAIPYWEFAILREKKVVLFLDEFSNSTPAVQAAMLQILNEREFPDGSKLPNATVIIGAMNPVETAADGYELGLPVTNRLKFIPWEPSFDTWAQGLITNWGQPDKISKDVLYWRKMVVEFLKRNPSLLYKLPEKNQGKDPGTVYGFNDSPAETDIFKMAYPSNRSWTNYATELAYCESKPTLMQKAGNGLVGYEAATKFMLFASRMNSAIPSIQEALETPSVIRWDNLDSNDILNLLNEAVDYGEKNQSPQVAMQVGQLFLSAAQHDHTAEGTPLIERVMRITRRADRTGGFSKQIRMAYSGIGQLMR